MSPNERNREEAEDVSPYGNSNTFFRMQAVGKSSTARNDINQDVAWPILSIERFWIGVVPFDERGDDHL